MHDPNPAEAASERAIVGAIAAVEGSVARLPERDAQFAIREVIAQLFERIESGDYGTPIRPPSRRPGPDRHHAAAGMVMCELTSNLRDMPREQAAACLALVRAEVAAVDLDRLDPAG